MHGRPHPPCLMRLNAPVHTQTYTLKLFIHCEGKGAAQNQAAMKV